MSGFQIDYDDIQWLDSVVMDEVAISKKVIYLKYVLQNKLNENCEIAWLLRAVTCIDLTTLSGDDTDSNVEKLCYKAAHPLSNCLLGKIELQDIKTLTTAAVCVYPARVNHANQMIQKFNKNGKLNLASVSTGFPSGQYPLNTKLKEIEYCVENGANEIDIVISREHVISNNWNKLYDEIKQMRMTCDNSSNADNVHMKTILATGECGSLTNVYKASLVAMLAGSDFIKTSTGKESVNATLQVGIVMCRAIKDFYQRKKIRIGFKPAGGIKTAEDAIIWLLLIKEELGNEWLNSKLFRFGASSLLTDIEKRLFFLLYGYKPVKECFFNG